LLEPTEEPPTKRLRASITSDSQIDEHSEELQEYDSEATTYTAELIVFDKHKTCLLTDGDYELLLHDNSEANNTRRTNTFESKFKNKVSISQHVYFSSGIIVDIFK